MSFLFRFSQIDKTKALKALMSSDHRRQSLQLANKTRRSSIQLERRGTIRRDSRVPLLDTPTDGILGRKREVITGTETDSPHPERDNLAEQKEDMLASAGTESQADQPFDNSAQAQEKAKRESLAEQKKGMLASAGGESQTEQPSDSVTDQGDKADTTEQGPPAVRRNTLFPEQDSTNAAQTQEKVDDKSSPKELQQNKEMGDNRGSKEPQPIKNDAAQAQGKTDDNSLQPHTGRRRSHLLNEIKNITQGFGVICSEDQTKEQVTIMAQKAIDSKYFILIIFFLA